MSKETLSLVEEQKKLWNPIVGQQGLDKRIQQAKNGHLPRGLSLDEISEKNEFMRVLGPFASKVLLASDPNNTSIIPEQIAIAGGWCAIRTADVNSIGQNGVIMNPITGSLETIDSVEQVAKWIASSPTFDQVVESIGAPLGAEYVLISERRLWTTRITNKLSQIFARDLSGKEKNLLERGIEEAEIKRSIMTKRYLRFVTQNSDIKVKRIVDEDIWEELQDVQKDLFKKINISVEDLENAYPNEASIISSSALVWSMYSEPYFDMLRTNNAITKKTVFVAEPVLHTYADNQSGNTVVNTIYQDKGIYFEQGGINPNTGFIAFIECVGQNGMNVRKRLQVGEVPNISNWKNLFELDNILDIEKNSVLDVKQNLLFIWGINFLPFGKTKQALLRLTELQEEFQREKEKITSSFSKSSLKKDENIRNKIQSQINELRLEFRSLVANENSVIARDLKNLFTILTSDLEMI